MEDYLVVGLGLAGMAFCETLEQHGKSFRVLDDHTLQASKVAGGIYNPVVLKRLKRAWKADVQLPLVAPFYKKLEEKLQIRCHHSLPVLRLFASVAEQNRWFAAADTTALRPFLSTEIHHNQNPGLNAQYGFGQVIGTGRVDTAALLTAYSRYLKNAGRYMDSCFDFNRLKLKPDHVSYEGVDALKIVFATGYRLLDNPFFNYLPLQGNKGEYLEIRCPELRETHIIKGPVFLIPLGDDAYLAGATYEWKDMTATPGFKAREYLCRKLDEMLEVPYEITGQLAGIRPTIPDRRPLVGRHPEYKQLFLINGFGSRGVMIAPYAAEQLWAVAENGQSADPEMDVQRYKGKWLSS